MPLFDAYLMVDWSAAARPRRGRDSIWYALVRRRGPRLVRVALANPPTRAAAVEAIADHLARLAAAGLRTLAGFDFPFGYPAGTGAALGLAPPYWRATWRLIADRLEDRPDNRNNRFDVAAALNQAISGRGFPFWGHPNGHAYRPLAARKPTGYGPRRLAERRLVEGRVPSAKSAWQLNGAGSVGGQVLTGLPRLLALRRDPRLAGVSAVWPFETGLRHDGGPSILFAEVYPSLFPLAVGTAGPKDAAQVAGAAAHFARADRAGALAALFAADRALSPAERAVVEGEEAWILGVVGAAAGAANARPRP